MDKIFYIRFSDHPKSVKVSHSVFRFAIGLSKTYGCLISIVPNRFGRTLYVGFSYFFFHSQLCYEFL